MFNASMLPSKVLQPGFFAMVTLAQKVPNYMIYLPFY
jgi:hypothetical protein